jgi:type I restriction enzyme, R subunit
VNFSREERRSAAQIELANMVIEHDRQVAPTGPDELFGEERVTRLFSKIEAINASAVA